MRILSFDQATAATGWALFEDGELQNHGIINCKKIKDSAERIHEMVLRIHVLIEDLKPDTVVVEGVVLQRSALTLKELAKLQGMILGVCICCDIDAEILLPSQWRSAIKIKQGKGIKREELKKKSIEYVMCKFGINVTDDEADAICIGSSYNNKFIV